ncbi:hypothetical protein EAN25_18800 [Salmonella enterica]|nr:hypothetical protein [Salmonella enterica]
MNGLSALLSGRLTRGKTDNGIFISGDEQNFFWLRRYAREHYDARAYGEGNICGKAYLLIC